MTTQLMKVVSLKQPSYPSFPSLAVRLSLLQATGSWGIKHTGAGLGPGNETKPSYVTTDDKQQKPFVLMWERPLPVSVLPRFRDGGDCPRVFPFNSCT